MNSLAMNLVIFYLGGSFIIVLIWAGAVGEILVSEVSLGGKRSGLRWLIGLLALVGLVHPAAALAAWDLIRLGRTTEEPPLDFSGTWERSAQAASLVSVVAVGALCVDQAGVL